MVDVLTGVSLVVHHKPWRAETKVLHEYAIAQRFLVTEVCDLDAPKPKIEIGVEPQSHEVANASVFAFPNYPIVDDAKPTPRSWPDDRKDFRIRAAHTQIKAAHAACDRRGKQLIDHNAAAGTCVFDGKKGTGGEQADRHA